MIFALMEHNAAFARPQGRQLRRQTNVPVPQHNALLEGFHISGSALSGVLRLIDLRYPVLGRNQPVQQRAARASYISN